ncbi:hypothetical protein [Caulobacter endophyticus]|uniref:Uncharacterized protein n=1 Tax=Caulobacter endophyticus TaxID=2172652 RepID=A0A2T9JIA3_9CAUL|nr:hypothetical protein [Caulobacter endophyticus]PVM83431.1 hypothetical protein DDF67_21085 [Caulobacter endophyticus]
MRIATALAVTLLAAAPALAQTTAPPAAQTAVPAYSADTPLAEVVADPAAKAVLDKTLPNLAKHPAFEQFKAMSLRQLRPYASGAISEEAVGKVDAELKALTAKP